MCFTFYLIYMRILEGHLFVEKGHVFPQNLQKSLGNEPENTYKVRVATYYGNRLKNIQYAYNLINYIPCYSTQKKWIIWL